MKTSPATGDLRKETEVLKENVDKLKDNGDAVRRLAISEIRNKIKLILDGSRHFTLDKFSLYISASDEYVLLRDNPQSAGALEFDRDVLEDYFRNKKF